MHTIAAAPALGRVLERRQVSNSTSIVSPNPSTSSAVQTSITTKSGGQHSSSAAPGKPGFSSSTTPDTGTHLSGTSSINGASENNPDSTNTATGRTQPNGSRSPTNLPPGVSTGAGQGISNHGHVSPSGLVQVLVGSLTTTFTPPADCTSPIISASGSTSDYITQGFGATGGITDIYIHRQSCYPGQPDLLNQIPMYSPGICPYGWSMHSFGVTLQPGKPDWTTGLCCP
jgi:hypothetical protein